MTRQRWVLEAASSRLAFGQLVLAFVLCCIAVELCAQEPSAPPAVATPPAVEPELTADVVASRRKQVEETKDLDEEVRKRAIDFYKRAQDELKRAAELTARTAELKKQAASASERQTIAKADIVSLKSKADPELPSSATLAVIEQELAKRQAELDALRKTQAELEAEPNRRANRRKDVRASIVSAPDRLAEVIKQLEAATPADEPPAITLARRTELAAQRKMLAAETPSLEAELALYDAEDVVDLIRLKRDLQAQEVNRSADLVEKLTALVNQRRREEAENALRQARQQQLEANPLLQNYADENTRLAQAAHDLTVELEDADKELQQTRNQLEQLEKEFEQTRQKVESIGLTGPIGLLLRKQRADLPDVRAHRRSAAERRDLIEEVQFKLFELDEERSLLANLDPALDEILRSAPADLSSDEKRDLEQSAREILERRRQFLDTANRSYVSFIDKLVDIDVTERKLIEQVDKSARYIDERVLWIRSSRILGIEELRRDRSFSKLANFNGWMGIGRHLYEDVRDNPIPFLSALLLFGALEYYRGRFRRELREIGTQVQRGTFSKFAPTMRAVMLTAILALFGPSLVTYFAWRIGNVSQDGDLGRAVSAGLFAVAAAYWPFEFVRQSFRNDGLAEAHFGWTIAAIRLVRRRLRLIMLCGLPLLFLTVTLSEVESEQGRDAFERLTFITAMVAGAVFIWSLLNPTRGIIRDVASYDRGGWLDRLMPVWQALGVVPALLMAGLAFAGYYYTAQQFASRIESTIWLLVGCLYLRGLLLRLVLVHRRRLSIEQARERRAAAEERAASSDAAATANITTEAEKGADLAKISSQTQRLLNVALSTFCLVGFWWIWIDVLPALNFLDRWPLWTISVQASEEVVSSTGQRTTRLVDKTDAVTVANLAAALLIAIVTFISARNVPGVLEMSLLQRLPFDAAGRYAATSIAKYLIVMLGVVLAGTTIGVGWSKIQWLATALTFGLAFGLQEIFANFVAGVIILFERPIRVGDVVTIADVSGVVSRIRIRATTITNWDRKEFIVPNKEFITGRLLNWTLSDTTNRVVLNVGVAYGTDPNLARKLLLESAHEQPTVLEEPAPTATFEQFGDSTLNFVLNVFLPDLGGRVDVIHNLHTSVYQKFRDAGIEIAFPQRDIHIRSADGFSSHTLLNGQRTNGSRQAGESSHVAEEA
ncbi:MAG: mechanosensitive ion channel domain-containing protein [Planctomycetaceae bacterium]